MKKTFLFLLFIALFFLVGSSLALAQTTSSFSSFGNPINPTTIEEVLENIWTYLRGIAGTIAVIFIIIGGVMYMLSGGDKDRVETAKKCVVYALVGLAIVLAAPYFYNEFKAILGGNSPGSTFKQILANVLQLLLSIVGFLAIISMIVGAIWMFTAAGDEDRYELGKKTVIYSIIGLIIAVSALVIAQEVINLFGIGNSGTNFNTMPKSDARFSGNKK